MLLKETGSRTKMHHSKLFKPFVFILISNIQIQILCRKSHVFTNIFDSQSHVSRKLNIVFHLRDNPLPKKVLLSILLPVSVVHCDIFSISKCHTIQFVSYLVNLADTTHQCDSLTSAKWVASQLLFRVGMHNRIILCTIKNQKNNRIKIYRGW